MPFRRGVVGSFASRRKGVSAERRHLGRRFHVPHDSSRNRRAIPKFASKLRHRLQLSESGAFFSSPPRDYDFRWTRFNAETWEGRSFAAGHQSAWRPCAVAQDGLRLVSGRTIEVPEPTIAFRSSCGDIESFVS
jgi:hypothetical protein